MGEHSDCVCVFVCVYEREKMLCQIEGDYRGVEETQTDNWSELWNSKLHLLTDPAYGTLVVLWQWYNLRPPEVWPLQRFFLLLLLFAHFYPSQRRQTGPVSSEEPLMPTTANQTPSFSLTENARLCLWPTSPSVLLSPYNIQPTDNAKAPIIKVHGVICCKTTAKDEMRSSTDEYRRLFVPCLGVTKKKKKITCKRMTGETLITWQSKPNAHFGIHAI